MTYFLDWDEMNNLAGLIFLRFVSWDGGFEHEMLCWMI